MGTKLSSLHTQGSGGSFGQMLRSSGSSGRFSITPHRNSSSFDDVAPTVPHPKSLFQSLGNGPVSRRWPSTHMDATSSDIGLVNRRYPKVTDGNKFGMGGVSRRWPSSSSGFMQSRHSPSPRGSTHQFGLYHSPPMGSRYGITPSSSIPYAGHYDPFAPKPSSMKKAMATRLAYYDNLLSKNPLLKKPEVDVKTKETNELADKADKPNDDHMYLYSQRLHDSVKNLFGFIEPSSQRVQERLEYFKPLYQKKKTQ